MKVWLKTSGEAISLEGWRRPPRMQFRSLVVELSGGRVALFRAGHRVELTEAQAGALLRLLEGELPSYMTYFVISPDGSVRNAWPTEPLGPGEVEVSLGYHLAVRDWRGAIIGMTPRQAEALRRLLRESLRG